MDLRELFDKVLLEVESNDELNKIFTEQLTKNETEICKQISRFKAFNRLSAAHNKGDEDYDPEKEHEYYKDEMKRLVEQFLEREYFYSFRKVMHRYEDADGVHVSKHDALETTNRTWDGENDILGMMYLKLSHMIHNLHDNGFQKDLYIDSYHFEKSKHPCESDLNWAKNKVIETHFGPNVKDYNNTYGYKHSEEDYVNRFFLGNVEVDKSESDSGYKHYYLTEYHTPDLSLVCIENSVDVQIDPNEIPKEKKLYHLNLKNMDEHIEAPQYRIKGSKYTLVAELKTPSLDEAYNVFVEKNIGIEDVIDSALSNENSLDIDWKDFSLLSPTMKEHIRGNIVTIRQLWQLRKTVNALIDLDDLNDKYTAMWENISDDKERFEMMKKSGELYLEDRRKLYQEICDQMNKYGRGWWD